MTSCIAIMLVISVAVLVQDMKAQNGSNQVVYPGSINGVDCLKNPGFVFDTEGSAQICHSWSNHVCNFTLAKAECEDKGARLAVFNTLDLMKIWKKHYTNRQRWHWIGLDSMKSKKNWNWHDGTHLEKKDYKNFFLSTEPNNDFDGNVCAHSYSVTEGFADLYCWWNMYFICEKPEFTKKTRDY